MKYSPELKEIPGFPGYEIKYDGRVFKYGKEKIVSCKKGRSAKVVIMVNHKMYTLGLATLIADAFIPNPFKFTRIIFKNRNHHNCHADNIAWVDDETYFYYCCKGVIKRGRPKIFIERNEAIRLCSDENLRNYYISLDELWLQEAWNEIEKDFSQFDYWPEVKTEIYLYFIERCKRFSILHKPTAILYYRMRGEYLNQKKEISCRLPLKKLLQTDESLRIIGRENYEY